MVIKMIMHLNVITYLCETCTAGIDIKSVMSTLNQLPPKMSTGIPICPVTPD